jgi:predicted nucleic acid-binding protein
MASPSHFIDSNIPMYARGAEHPLKAPCIAVLAQITSGKMAAVTSVEVIQEIVHRYSLIGRRQQARPSADDFLLIVPTVLPVTAADMRLMLTYLGEFPRLSPRDLLHVAVMVNNGIQSIISADTDFDQVPHIKRVDPRSAALVAR